jgi:hypothetical protein
MKNCWKTLLLILSYTSMSAMPGFKTVPVFVNQASIVIGVLTAIVDDAESVALIVKLVMLGVVVPFVVVVVDVAVVFVVLVAVLVSVVVPMLLLLSVVVAVDVAVEEVVAMS